MPVTELVHKRQSFEVRDLPQTHPRLRLRLRSRSCQGHLIGPLPLPITISCQPDKHTQDTLSRPSWHSPWQSTARDRSWSPCFHKSSSHAGRRLRTSRWTVPCARPAGSTTIPEAIMRLFRTVVDLTRFSPSRTCHAGAYDISRTPADRRTGADFPNNAHVRAL